MAGTLSVSAFPLHEEAGRGVGAVTPSNELLQGISCGVRLWGSFLQLPREG